MAISLQLCSVLAAAVLAGAPFPAFAQTVPTRSDAWESTVLDDRELSAIAGREDTRQISLANQVTEVTDNSVGDNVRTGDARISDNAFQNMSGLTILNVNTGNNVAINAAMNVNIAIIPQVVP